MFLRAHYEEVILTSAFPEYARYRREVGMFGPKLFQHAAGDYRRSHRLELVAQLTTAPIAREEMGRKRYGN